MDKLLVLIGLMLGGWIGWVAGAPFGILAAFMLSIVGTALGLYLGRTIARDYF